MQHAPTCEPRFGVERQEPPFRLGPRIFIAWLGDRAVVLDVARDRYFALNPVLSAAAIDLISGGDDRRAPQAAREKLLAEGIFKDAPRTERDRRAEAPPAPPARSLWPSETPDNFAQHRTSPIASAEVLWALTETAWRLKHRPLHETVDWMSRQAPARRGARRPTQQLLDEYHAARPWFPVRPVCRLDALALGLHLRRNGCAAAVVFGVKLEPFEAHCWVHADGSIINEPHETVSAYTPIMAV